MNYQKGETPSIFFPILQELKQKQKEGKPLELNQLEKLKSEQEVLNKIQELKLESSKAASSTFST